MPTQEQKSKSSKRKSETEQGEVKPKEDAKAKGARLKGELDDLLDEIDEVLAGNETLAQNYVQKGGE